MSKLTSTAPTELLSAVQASPAAQAVPGVPISVPFPRWRRARDRACAALLAGERRLLVTGPAGTGKTALLHEIARILRYAGWDVTVWQAGLLDGEDAAATGPLPLLLVDEADRLTDAQLHRLGESAGAVVLAGLDGIGLRWEAGARISLSRLTASEAREFVAQWRAAPGHAPTAFAADAVDRVVELGAGTPRVLAALLGGASWMAGAAAGGVTRQHVDDAAALRACLVEEHGRPACSPAAAEPAPAPPEPEPPRLAEPAPLAPVCPRRRKRSVLGPALAACCVLAGAGGAAAYRWPSRAEQALASARARIDDYLPRPKRVEAEPVSAPDVIAPAPLQAEPVAARAADAFEPAPAAAEPAPTPTPTPASEEPASAPDQSSPAEAQAAPAPLPPPVTASVALPSAPLAPPPVSPAPLAPAVVETLLRRGNEMLGLGDFTAARLLFARAAQAGDATAMLALARSYDPAANVSGPRPTPDLEAAANWYRRAAAAGSAEADARLRQIERHAAR